METCNIPPSFKLKDNVALPDNWVLWKQQLQNYMIAMDLDEKREERKVATLLNLIGVEGLQLYNTFDFEPATDRLVYAKVLEKFDAYCAPKRNKVYEHFKFFSRGQLENESTDQFLTVLKTMASTCEFAERDVMLVDRIVLGTRYKPLQERLLREPDLTLIKAMELAHAYELSKIQIMDIQKTALEVDKVTIADRPKWRREDNGNKPETNTQKTRTGDYHKCNKCSYDHTGRSCPANNKQCNRCKRTGHFAAVCTGRRVGAIELQEGSNIQSDSVDIVWQISGERNVKDWEEQFLINGKQVTMKIDTGSQVNIITNRTYQSITNKPSQDSTRSLLSYSGHKIPHRGVVVLSCEKDGLVQDLQFYIAEAENARSLIGLKAIRTFGMTKEHTVNTINEGATNKSNPEEILRNYGTVFGLGGKLNRCYKIRLKEGATPLSTPPRKIPVAIQKEVKLELDDMVKRGILVPITEPTEWVSPIVVVRKPNKKLRICMDPRNLNKYILRERCWIPTMDTVLTGLAGATVFTVLDASNAFHQIPLDRASSLLCTIATPYGRYRYTRLPYGLSSAPEVFQQALYNVLDGLTGVINYIDDIVVFGANMEEHNHRLQAVLERIHNSGLKLSKEKLQLAVGEISYLGHKISKDGVQIDPKKTQAIASMQTPQSKKELQRFLGMITYLAKHLPALSQTTMPLRALLSEKNHWVWELDGPQARAFEQLKGMVTGAPVLQHFVSSQPLVLSVDASSHGLGAVLLQMNKPVAYASVSLTTTQQRYSQIEKELLAVVYSCEHFHYYTFGRSVLIHTDHKPLLALIRKPIDDLTPRLQKLVLRLLRYEVTLQYVPGKTLQAADALSRSPMERNHNTSYLDSVSVALPITITDMTKMEKLEYHTKEDDELSELKKFLKQGWPKRIKQVPMIIRKYWSIRNELHTDNGLLFKGSAICIPKMLQPEFLQMIHGTHQGIQSSRLRAKEALYWPGMMMDIQTKVSECVICQSYARANNKETMHPHEPPTFPWEKVAIDFKSEGESQYLVIVDCFSKFVNINKIHDKTADTVLQTLMNIFGIFGLPTELYSDNGPPFDSDMYNKFLKKLDIAKRTSSPNYPESNGMIERTIQIAKSMLKKNGGEAEELFQSVLNYNATPKPQTSSPAELLMGRRLRTIIPLSDQLRTPSYDIAKHQKHLKKNKAAMSAMRRERILPKLVTGDKVFLQRGIRNWEPAVIAQALPYNSFKILTQSGKVIRRNRIHLRKRNDAQPLPNIEPTNMDDNKWTDQQWLPNIQKAPNPELPSSPKPEISEGLQDQIVVTSRGRIIRPPKRLDL